MATLSNVGLAVEYGGGTGQRGAGFGQFLNKVGDAGSKLAKSKILSKATGVVGNVAGAFSPAIGGQINRVSGALKQGGLGKRRH